MPTEQSKVLTLVFTDLADSTALKTERGDVAVGELITRHREHVTRLAGECAGRVIDWAGDGCFLTFETPSSAVKFAFDLQQFHANEPELPGVRIGMHMGEVTDKPGPEQTTRVEGLAVDLAARISGLALPGQLLMSSGVFNSARQRLRAEDFDTDVTWLAHGAYELKGFDEPMELCEVGIEGRSPLLAPTGSDKAHRIVTPKDEETLGWRPAVGQHVPRRENWRLEEQLGVGGFGEVWLAIHEKTKAKRVFKFCFEPERVRGLKREVVLFRLLKESLGDREDIAQILDWEFERSPYFLESEYTEGGDLRDWASNRGGLTEVPLNVRTEIVAQIATALGAAHSVGVLHKDIKPANILISEVSGRDKPRASLTDFGIGLITDPAALAAQGITAAGLTETLVGSSSSDSGTGAGTRIYMAPELLEGHPATTRSDLYSLGVVLYQLVTGDLNHSVAAGWERDVGDELLREDIAACIDGNPDLRLSSADELAERLRTIEARRRERKAQRRNQTLRRRFTIASAAGITLTILFGVYAFQQASRAASEKALRIEAEEARLRAERSQQEADAQRERAEQERAQADTLRAVAEERRYISDVQLARLSLERGDMAGAQRSLEGTPEQFRGWEWGYLANAAWPPVATAEDDTTLDENATALERWDGATDSLVATLDAHEGPVNGLGMSPDGRFLATNGTDGTCRLWSTETWELLHDLEGFGNYSGPIPFTPDSAYVARNNAGNTATVHDTRTGEIAARLEYPHDAVLPFGFNADGNVVGTWTPSQRIIFWNWRQETILAETEAGPVMQESPGNTILSIGAFTDDPNHYMMAWERNSYRIIDVRSGEVVDELGYPSRPGLMPVALNPSRTVVFAFNFEEHYGDFYRLSDGAEVGQFALRFGREQYPAAFSYDGTLFGIKLINNQIHLLSIPAGEQTRAAPNLLLRAVIHNAPGSNYGNAFTISPDGRFIAIPGRGGSVRILTPTGAQLGEAMLTLDHDESVYSARFEPDGRHVLTASYDGLIHRWDLETGTKARSVHAHDAEIHRISISNDGQYIESSSYDGTRKVWTRDLAEPLYSLENLSDTTFAGGPRGVLVRLGTGAAQRRAFHPTEPLMLTGHADGYALVQNIETGETIHRLEGHRMYPYRPEFTRDGVRVVTHGYQESDIKVWDTGTGELVYTLAGPGQVIHTLTSPDDRYLASTHINGDILLWDLHADDATPEPLKTFAGHSGAVITIDVHPTKPLMVTASVDQTARLWNCETGEALHTLTGHSGVVPVARFNTSGTRILTGSQDDTVRIWDLEGNEIATLPVGGSFVTVEWSEDERRIAATTIEGVVQVWSAAPWVELKGMGAGETAMADRLRLWRERQAP